MHELSVTESLLNTASDYAQKNNAKKVICLNLQIGDLSGIIDESVQFYWDIISDDTICAKSTLNLKKYLQKFICQACKTEFLMGEDLRPCPKLHEYGYQGHRGRRIFTKKHRNREK